LFFSYEAHCVAFHAVEIKPDLMVSFFPVKSEPSVKCPPDVSMSQQTNTLLLLAFQRWYKNKQKIKHVFFFVFSESARSEAVGMTRNVLCLVSLPDQRQ
jgi:hypothetical protein